MTISEISLVDYITRFITDVDNETLNYFYSIFPEMHDTSLPHVDIINSLKTYGFIIDDVKAHEISVLFDNNPNYDIQQSNYSSTIKEYVSQIITSNKYIKTNNLVKNFINLLKSDTVKYGDIIKHILDKRELTDEYKKHLFDQIDGISGKAEGGVSASATKTRSGSNISTFFADLFENLF